MESPPLLVPRNSQSVTLITFRSRSFHKKLSFNYFKVLYFQFFGEILLHHSNQSSIIPKLVALLKNGVHGFAVRQPNSKLIQLTRYLVHFSRDFYVENQTSNKNHRVSLAAILLVKSVQYNRGYKSTLLCYHSKTLFPMVNPLSFLYFISYSKVTWFTSNNGDGGRSQPHPQK